MPFRATAGGFAAGAAALTAALCLQACTQQQDLGWGDGSPTPPATRSVAVALSGGATGHVLSVPTGIDCPGTCSATFPGAQAVTLDATVDAPGSFYSWSGCGSVNGSECTIDPGGDASTSAKMLAEGEIAWAVAVGGSNDDYALGISASPSGEIFLTGAYDGNVDFGDGTVRGSSGFEDGFLASFEADDGSLTSAVTLAGGGDEWFYDMAFDGNVSAVVGGFDDTSVSFGGGVGLTSSQSGFDGYVLCMAGGAPGWAKAGLATENNDWSAAFDGANGLVTAGRISTAGGDWDIRRRSTADGSVSWDDTFGGSAFDQVDVIRYDGGTIWAAGIVSSTNMTMGAAGLLPRPGTEAGVLAKIDSATGAVSSARTFGPANGSAQVWGLAISGGDVVIGGDYSGGSFTVDGKTIPASISTDVFAMKFDSSGIAIWARGFGGGNFQDVYQVAALPDGDVILAGDFTKNAVFGSFTLTTPNDSDAFVVRLDGLTGDVKWAQQLGGTGADYAYWVDVDPQGFIDLDLSITGTIQMAGQSLGHGGEDAVILRLAP
jgi:hypothetical protein